MSYLKFQRLKRLEKTLNVLVYTSAIIDILIFLVTTYTLISHSSLEHMILPLNILLSIVVVLTLILGAALLFTKHFENIIFKITYGIPRALKNLNNKRYRYKPKR